MKKEPQNLTDFIKAHRDQAPAASGEEWQQIMASRSGKEAGPRPGFMLPAAIASGILTGAAALMLFLYPVLTSGPESPGEPVTDPAGEFLFLSQELNPVEEDNPLDDYWLLAESL